MAKAGQVGKAVNLNLVPMERVDNESKHRLVNTARKEGQTLGVLLLTHEEVEYLMDNFVTGAAIPTTYQAFLTERLKNPFKYTIDQKKLSEVPVAEQFRLINKQWDEAKELPDPAQRQFT